MLAQAFYRVTKDKNSFHDIVLNDNGVIVSSEGVTRCDLNFKQKGRSWVISSSVDSTWFTLEQPVVYEGISTKAVRVDLKDTTLVPGRYEVDVFVWDAVSTDGRFAGTLIVQIEGPLAAPIGGLPMDVFGNLRLAVDTPATITSNQNDYSPGTASHLRLTSDDVRTITGIEYIADGMVRMLTNIGANQIVLAHDDVNSAAANRILTHTGQNIIINAGDTISMIYDGPGSRWRVYPPTPPFIGRTPAEISLGVVPVNPDKDPNTMARYGTNTLPGMTDMSAALNTMMDVAEEDRDLNLRSEVKITGKILVNSTVTIQKPDGITIDAVGASFTTPNDIVMFDCHGDADPTYVSSSESEQDFWWIGGDFICTASSPTAATGLLLRGFRNAGVERAHFVGFWAAINFSGKDTLYLKNLKFFNNERCVYNQPWSTIGGLLSMFFEGLHCSHSKTTYKPAIEINEPWNDCHIDGSSFNLGAGAAHDPGVVYIKKQVILYATGTAGWTIGEEITDLTTGATMDLDDVVVYADGSIRLMGSNRSVTQFGPGNVVEGGTSLKTATLSSNARLISDNPQCRSISYTRHHMESGSGSDGAIGLYLHNAQGGGSTPVSTFIGNNSFGNSGSNDPVGVKLVDWTKVRFSTNVFPHTAGNGIPIQLDSDCNDIIIDRDNFFSTAAIDLNGMLRDRLTIGQESVPTGGALTAITGYNGASFSTSTATIDMSTDYPLYETFGGLPPKAYTINVQVNDSGSAASTNAGARLSQSASENTNTRAGVLCSGAVNDANIKGQVYVRADANGDIFADLVASGVTTLDVWLVPVRQHF